MNFIRNFVGGEEDANYQQNQNYGGSCGGNNQGPPPVKWPWEAEWDDNQNRYIFINRETGQRTFDYNQVGGGLAAFEQGGVGGVAGYEDQRIDNDYDREKYRVEGDIYNAPENAARWAGREEQRVEDIPQDVDNWGRRKEDEIENIPEDVAGWTGRKVQEVEDIPQDIGQGIEDVVDAPKRWFEREEGRVENFDDRVDNAYDQGEEQQEYRDDNRYNRY